MKYRGQALVLGVTLFILPVSAWMQGPRVADILRTSGEEIVTRGDFVRSAVTVLGLSLVGDADGAVLPFRRAVPKNLLPYVRTAHLRNALKVFGDDFGHSRGITRGQALQVLVALQGLHPKKPAAEFGDVKAGTALADAVAVAVELEWMRPLRPRMFGAENLLTGREGQLLLSRVIREEPSALTPGKQPGTEIQRITVKVVPKKKAVELPKEGILRTVWQLLNDQFLYNDRIKADDAGYKAVDAMVQSVSDPYTTFMPPIPARQFQSQIQGEVSGIGAQVEFIDEVLTIVAPLPDSPAAIAGLKPGDQVIAIDGVSIKGLSFAESVDKIRGPKGSQVRLTINRDGVQLDVTLTRAIIKVPEIKITFQENIAIIALVQFGETTQRELRSLMAQVQGQSPKGIILDLRNNPGGLLHAAEVVLSNFLPAGSTVAKIESRTDGYEDTTQDPPTIAAGVPVIVLVNGGSASASEIVAGALQDAGRAKLLGEKTFGKGTVQQVLEFNDGSSLKMTIAEWLTPKGRKIDGVGIEPDIVMAGGTDRDEQLLKALELLR